MRIVEQFILVMNFIFFDCRVLFGKQVAQALNFNLISLYKLCLRIGLNTGFLQPCHRPQVSTDQQYTLFSKSDKQDKFILSLSKSTV